MITILMSTYNGARYLRTQLDSILRQDMADWRLMVRDDGSSDDTPAILQEYAGRNARIRVVSDGENKGALRGFEALLAQYGTEGYVAFADQDDEWLPMKLRVCEETLRRAEQRYGTDRPIVVHTDLEVVDADLQPIAKSFWAYSNIHPEISDEEIHYLALCNSVTGCAMMMNQVARRVSLPFGRHAMMHDYAVAMAVKEAGGKIIPIETATIRYRQHGKNALGAVRYSLWRSGKVRLQEARDHYRAFAPRVFKNVWHFVYWKARYFVRLHWLRR